MHILVVLNGAAVSFNYVILFQLQEMKSRTEPDTCKFRKWVLEILRLQFRVNSRHNCPSCAGVPYLTAVATSLLSARMA